MAELRFTNVASYRRADIDPFEPVVLQNDFLVNSHRIRHFLALGELLEKQVDGKATADICRLLVDAIRAVSQLVI